MMLRLQNYHFTIQYKKREKLFVADTLSLAALSDGSHFPSRKQEYYIFLMDLAQMDLSPTFTSLVQLIRSERRL